MSFIRTLKAVCERKSLSDVIPVIEADDESGMFFIRRHNKSLAFDFGFCWITAPLVGVNHERCSDLEELLAMDLPPRTVMQIQRFASPNIEPLVQRYYQDKYDVLRPSSTAFGLSEEMKEELLPMVKARRDFINRGAFKPILKDHELLLKRDIGIVSVRFSNTKTEPTAEFLKKVAGLAARVEGQLDKLGAAPRRIRRNEYAQLLCGVLRDHEHLDRELDDDRPINEQIGTPEDEIEIQPTHLRVNKRFIKSLSAHFFPKKCHLSRMLPLFGDPNGSRRQIRDPYLASLNVIFLNQVKETADFHKNRLTAQHFASKQLIKLSKRLKFRVDNFDTMENDLANGAQFRRVWWNFLTFADTEEGAAVGAQVMKTHGYAYDWDLRDDKTQTAVNFFQNLPLCGEERLEKQLARYRTLSNRHAAHIAPIMGEWTGNSVNPIQIYMSRRGALMGINNWESQSGYNVVITAETGAGKSFFLQDFSRNSLSQGVKVNIFDKGRSFKKMVERLHGNYFIFDEPGRYNLNPFERVKNINEEIEQLCGIVETMAAHGESLSKEQRAVIDHTLKELWDEKGTRIRIDDIARTLGAKGRATNDQRIKDLEELLFMFTTAGAHGEWFTKGEPLSFEDSMLTGVELGDLEPKPALYAVALQSATMDIQRLMYMNYKRQDRLRLLNITDEAQDLLSMPGPAKFLAKGYSQARKHGGSMVIITQNISNLIDTPGDAGRQIWMNAAFRFLLSQKNEMVDQMEDQKWLAIEKHALDALKTVHTAAGQYSEIFFDVPAQSGTRAYGIGRLIVSREEQLLQTTDPNEDGMLRKLMADGRSHEEAVKEYIRLENENRRAA